MTLLSPQVTRRRRPREVKIKAEANAQNQLLEVQASDTLLTQLQHRRSNLPEHAEVAGLRAQHDQLSQQLIAAQTEVSDLTSALAQAEADLVPVRQRRERDQQRIGDGSVNDPKVLSSLIDEVEHLHRRISNLEDAELEVMQSLEDATATQDRIATAQRGAAEALTSAVARQTSRVGELDTEIARTQANRADQARGLPSELLALYDKVRHSHGGVGAAALSRRRCTGCQLELNAADLQRYRVASADEVLRCEECNRILVRTEDSGL